MWNVQIVFYKIKISGYMKRGGNRILVNKLVYDFGKPKRWDVAVFKYPFNEIACLSCGYASKKINDMRKSAPMK